MVPGELLSIHAKKNCHRRGRMLVFCNNVESLRDQNNEILAYVILRLWECLLDEYLLQEKIQEKSILDHTD